MNNGIRWHNDSDSLEFPQKWDGGWRMDEARGWFYLVNISGVSSHQFYDAGSWATREAPIIIKTFSFITIAIYYAVLWRCWSGGRKGIRPVKTEWWGVGVVICLEWGADLHMTQLMPLPLTVSCFSKIQIGFTFLVPAHPGSPGQRAVKRVCVCVFNAPRVGHEEEKRDNQEIGC